MRASDVQPGQHFRLATDPRILRRVASEADVYGVDAEYNLVGCHPDSACELVEAPAANSLRFTIEHPVRNGKRLVGRVVIERDEVTIEVDGYRSRLPHISLVALEVGDDGHPRLFACDEYEGDSVTHRINLAGARVP